MRFLRCSAVREREKIARNTSPLMRERTVKAPARSRIDLRPTPLCPMIPGPILSERCKKRTAFKTSSSLRRKGAPVLAIAIPCSVTAIKIRPGALLFPFSRPR